MRAAIDQDARVASGARRWRRFEQRLASLTPREREVLAALAEGKLNKQIAADLGIVEQTVKFHRARIMERMQAKTVAELMHIAARSASARRPRRALQMHLRERTRRNPPRRKRIRAPVRPARGGSSPFLLSPSAFRRSPPLNQGLVPTLAIAL